jgi:hypothetical protein
MLSRRTVLALAFFAISSLTLVGVPQITAQQPKAGEKSIVRDPFYIEAPLWPPDLRPKAFDWKNGTVALDVSKSPQAVKDLELLAKILIYKVTDRKYFTPSIEQKFGFGKNEINVLANPDPAETMDGVMTQLNLFVLAPRGTEQSPYIQIEYIQEFGKAADAAIREVLKKAGNDPKAAIVRVNAGRVLASVCRSGASAHVQLVNELIKSETTPPELQYWALKAAENLIGAMDIIKAKEGRTEFHALKDQELALLVNTLDGAIKRYSKAAMPPPPPTTPPAANPPTPPVPPVAGNPPASPPMGKAAAPPTPAGNQPAGGRIEVTIKPPPYEPDVAMFLRKQAVRAVAKCRKVHFSDANNTLARPGVILARFAVGDPSIVPVAQPHEYAEAAMGLATMVPDNKVNIDVLLDATAAAVSGFGAWKVTGFDQPESKVVLWKKTATAIAGALAIFKTMPDKSPAANSYRQKITSLADICLREVIEPIRNEQEGVAATSARPDEVNRWRNEPANARKTDLLMRDDSLSKVTLPRSAGNR